jgi:hypothetical protein
VNEKRYEEVGHAYRYFLSWRHAAFAGYVLVLYGVGSLFISATKDAPSLAWVIPLAASPIGFFLWWIDRRTRDLYHAARRAGMDLEGQDGGFFTRLSETALPPGASVFSRTTQSGALNTFFLGFSLLLFAVGVTLGIRALYE